ncbi:hypothetical protein [Rhodococcus jostii]|uniref:hypothetical protein n=1 Tax=Rhodococcus jostii TaxID=132919 RepID=UPI003635C4E1
METVSGRVTVDSELAVRIAAIYRRQVASLRAVMFASSGEFPVEHRSDGVSWSPPGISVRSLTDRFLNITVQVSTRSLVSALPCDPTIEPGSWAVQLSVSAHHRRLHRTAAVPAGEGAAWSAAVFGPWAEDAYYLGARTHPLRCPDLHYALYLGGRYQPMPRPVSLCEVPHHLLSL